MKILALCDDFYHPEAVVRAGLAGFAGPGAEIVFSRGGGDVVSLISEETSVVVLAKSNNVSATDRSPWLNDEKELGLIGFVEQGGGLLAIHSGIADYREAARLQALIGGSFLEHPDQCPVTVEPTERHPVVLGVASYTVIRDEHYFVELTAPDALVVARTVSAAGTQPGCWVRRQGAGRVCVFTPGHTGEAWAHPQTRALLSNALRWCARPAS